MRESPKGLICWRLVDSGSVGERMRPDTITDNYKRVARWIGMSEKQVNQVSGHLALKGTARDLYGVLASRLFALGGGKE
jgi:hypothetical protein